MDHGGTPVSIVTLNYTGIDFELSIFRAAVGYSARWEGDGTSGFAGFMPTMEDVIALAKLRIEEHILHKNMRS